MSNSKHQWETIYKLFQEVFMQHRLMTEGMPVNVAKIKDIITSYQSFYETYKNAKNMLIPIDKPAEYYTNLKTIEELEDAIITGLNFMVNLFVFKEESFRLPAHPLMFTIIALFSGKYIKLPENLIDKPPELRTPEEQKIIDDIINSIARVEFSEKRNSMGESIKTISYLVTDNPYVRCLGRFENSLFRDDIDYQNDSIAFAIKRTFGAEGLKHMLGFFIAMHENSKDGYFILDINKHLEILGYKKHIKGGYKPELKKKAVEILQILCSLKLTIENKKSKDKQVITNQILFLLSGDKIFKEFGQVINEHIYITPNPSVFTCSDNPKLNKPFTRLLKSIAGVSHKEHPKTIFLGTLLPIFWRISGKEQSLSLRSIFQWLDIDMNKRLYLTRHIKNLLNELDYMMKKEFLGTWYIKDGLDIFKMPDPLNAIFVFHPPTWYKVGMLDLSAKREQYKQIETQFIDVNTIKNIMETKQLTVKQFANSINVSARTIYYILGGKHPITKKISDKVKNAYADACPLKISHPINCKN